MSNPQKVRDIVTKAYANAVSSPSTGGCCSGPVGNSEAVQLAGYTPEGLDALPSEAVVNSFGCGNPLAFGEVREGDIVLDLGSGAGIDLLIAGEKVGPTGRVIGVDMTDEMIAKARENIAAAGLSNIEVRKGVIENLPVESSSVDWVISNCVINLSPEKPKVFAEIARVLKPGGRMLVSDIVAEDLPAWMRHHNVLYTSCVAGALSEAAYIDGLRRAGLEEVEVRERIVYDVEQLMPLIRSDPADAGRGVGQAVVSLDERIESLAGKVWSAMVYARKTDHHL